MVLPCCCVAAAQAQQYKLRGTVADATTGETLIGANVVLKGTTIGTTTDIDGRFELLVNELPPYTLMISFVGYTTQEVEVRSLDKELKFRLGTDQVLLRAAEVVGSRISEKQKQAPLTVESMDVIAIREAPSGDFYESLGTLKGVDMTAASMGFKVINTRGFNSTSPVRSLQLIDGVDNQSPGLNFSLGNFLGASDLDVMKVDVVAGASTAYFGPGAFNGVISMTTKSPWVFPGLSVSAKAGERDLLEGCVRWAQKFKDSAGKDRFAYKLNLMAMRAEDWFARDYGATSNSPTQVGNPGRYDGVNIYGDENVTVNNDFSRDLFSRVNYPGLGLYLRPGYREADLVDYGTNNLKAGLSLHYKLSDSLEVIAASNYSRGSTVYQGENRYRLENVQFYQHKLELRREGTWFLRGYMTTEDAGDTYDIFTTGVRLQEAAGATREWNIKYFTLWETWIKPRINQEYPDFMTLQEALLPGSGITTLQQYDDYLAQFVANNEGLFTAYHTEVADSIAHIDNSDLDPLYVVGTDRFEAKLDEIRGKRFTEGGSLFYDRSKLAHAMGEYRFKLGSIGWDTARSTTVPKTPWGELVVGGSFRQYMPNSAGTIFRDTGDVVIRNREFGMYAGLEKKLMEDKLRTTVTLRMDKNQNFNALFSPAASMVYTPRQDRTFRFSFSSAIRNPTLADQYLYYNVGRAILLGNVDGQFEAGEDSLITLESFNAYRTSPTLLEGLNKLDYFNVDRLRPEQVRTIEVGYRGTHAEKFYIDASAYHSWYTDFIGYIIGLYGRFRPANDPQAPGYPDGGLQAYRLAANASSLVRTQGVNVGVSYFRTKMTYGVNYSYNQLVTGDDDPIIPAFNTPLNKFNLSFTGHDLKVPGTDKPNLGFGINWKFVEGFTFTGSPQFTGPIPSYDMVDAQVNVKFPAHHLTVKLGGSNLFGLVPLVDADVASEDKLDRVFDNRVRMVYGGPFVGRLAYIQLIYELDKR
ncbi:MAG: TonB-dependent receptor [Flavobacteriales bacterium]|nr:TonB-dependent receptor [Flavobacteriales bacterium]